MSSLSRHRASSTSGPRRRATLGGSRPNRGYALLLVCFLVAAVIIASWAAVPDLITQSKREREEEAIWRGEQYARGIRLYYRKNGRFPQTIEDLTEKKTAIRFMRQAYKDPTNKKDGEWRLIYIGPNGQLIGSLKRAMLPGLGAIPAPGSTQAAPGQLPPSGAATTGNPQVQAPIPPGLSSTATTAPGSAGRVIGGNIIGVGGTVAESSIKVYKDGTTYREWEFIWDPTQDAQRPAGTGLAPPPPPPPPRPRQ